ncbi:MAG TPA: hypothetical protein VMH27_15845 [Puia sp.]|nr:hypothetical protein [Puia sp.]
METEYRWLHSSIFYNRRQWNSLLAGGIAPFCSAAAREGRLKRFIVHFNEQRGQNVRVAFEVKKTFERPFLARLSDYFTNYLGLHPSSPPEQILPIRNFIGDFPVNKVFYHLYDLQRSCLNPACEEALQEFRHKFSDAMIIALAEEVIEPDLIETFFLYAGLTLLASFLDLSPPGCAADLRARCLQNLGQHDLHRIERLMMEFSNVLHEITADIREGTDSGTALGWLNNWRDACRNLTELSSSLDKPFHIDLFMLAMESLASQTNIPISRSRILMWSMVRETLDFHIGD